MNKIEQITADVLRVKRCLSKHLDQVEIITTEEALNILVDAEEHVNPDRPIAKLIHQLKNDIIEGNTEWRKSDEDEINSKLIPFTKQ